MTYKKLKLSEVIEQSSDRNNGLTNNILGVNLNKEMQKSNACLTGVDLSNYKLIKKGEFGCNLMVVGRDKRLAVALMEDDIGAISPAYYVFRVKDDDIIDPHYLMMIFRTEDFEKRLWFHADSGVRASVSWETFIDMEIPLPPIEKQREYVAVYSNLLKLSRNHEKSFGELQKLTDLFMDAMVEKYESKEIGNYIELVNKRNRGGFITDVRGVNIDKEFMPSVANLSGVDLSKYKIVDNNIFATNLMHVGRDERLPISLNSSGKPIIVSPAYFTFKMKEDANVLPEYLFLFMKRSETERYAGFICDSSVRGNLEWSRFIEIRIPVPPIDVQESIVAVHHALEMRKNLNERIKALIKEISPVLIKNAKDLCEV